MADPYVWIDPFVEIAAAKAAERSANYRASMAREEGRLDILKIEETRHGGLKRIFEVAAYDLAERYALDRSLIFQDISKAKAYTRSPSYFSPSEALISFHVDIPAYQVAYAKRLK